LRKFTFYKILQLRILGRSRAVTLCKRRHHGDASSALQRIRHITSTGRQNGQPISRRQLAVCGRTSRLRNMWRFYQFC